MRLYEIINEIDRRDFMKQVGKTAAATAGALALGSFALPSRAWPDELPLDFNFMDEFLSDKVKNTQKYKEFKDIGKKLLDTLHQIENQRKEKEKKKIVKPDAIEV